MLKDAFTTAAESYDDKRRSRKEAVLVSFELVACHLADGTEESKVLCLGFEIGLNL
jgi:hypothetical protein